MNYKKNLGKSVSPITRNQPVCHFQRKPKTVDEDKRILSKTMGDVQQNLLPSVETKNRPSKIADEMSNVALGVASLHNSTFGALRFNLSKDPAVIKIKDPTGDYELLVPFECLQRFQLDVLLGKNEINCPNVTVLLGDCQCFPEQPESIVALRCHEKNLNHPTINTNGMSTTPGQKATELLCQGWLNKEKPQVDNGGGDVYKDTNEAVLHNFKGGENTRKRFQREPLQQKPKEDKDFSAYRNNMKGFIKLLMEEGEYDFGPLNFNQVEGKKVSGIVNGEANDSTSRKTGVEIRTAVSHSDKGTNTHEFSTKEEVEQKSSSSKAGLGSHSEQFDNIAECKSLVKDILHKLNHWEDCQAESIGNICNPNPSKSESELSSSANFDTVKRLEDEFEDASSCNPVDHKDSLEKFFNSLKEVGEKRADNRKSDVRQIIQNPQLTNSQVNHKKIRTLQNESSDILWRSFLNAFFPPGARQKKALEKSRRKVHVNNNCRRPFESLLARSMAECLQRISTPAKSGSEELRRFIPSGRTKAGTCNGVDSFQIKRSTGPRQQERDTKSENVDKSEVQSELLSSNYEHDKPQKPRIFFNAKASHCNNYKKI